MAPGRLASYVETSSCWRMGARGTCGTPCSAPGRSSDSSPAASHVQRRWWMQGVRSRLTGGWAGLTLVALHKNSERTRSNILQSRVRPTELSRQLPCTLHTEYEYGVRSTYNRQPIGCKEPSPSASAKLSSQCATARLVDRFRNHGSLANFPFHSTLPTHTLARLVLAKPCRLPGLHPGVKRWAAEEVVCNGLAWLVSHLEPHRHFTRSSRHLKWSQLVGFCDYRTKYLRLGK